MPEGAYAKVVLATVRDVAIRQTPTPECHKDQADKSVQKEINVDRSRNAVDCMAYRRIFRPQHHCTTDDRRHVGNRADDRHRHSRSQMSRQCAKDGGYSGAQQENRLQ